MKSFLKMLIGGALGLTALYVTAKVSYQTGKDIADIEHQCEKSRQSVKPAETAEGHSEDIPENSTGEIAAQSEEEESTKKSGLLFCLKQVFFGIPKKNGVLRKLLKHPEEHKLEAWVDGDDVHIDIRRKQALA